MRDKVRDLGEGCLDLVLLCCVCKWLRSCKCLKIEEKRKSRVFECRFEGIAVSLRG